MAIKPICEIIGYCDNCGVRLTLNKAKFVRSFNERLVHYVYNSKTKIYEVEKRIGMAWRLDGLCDSCFKEDWELRIDMIKRLRDINKYIDEDEWAELIKVVKSTYSRKLWKYSEYLESSVWTELREEVLEESGNQCEVCGCETNMLHHESYRFLYTEYESVDLIPVCHPCHKHIHKNKQVI